MTLTEAGHGDVISIHAAYVSRVIDIWECEADFR
jgi:hypothetical protein